MQLLSNLLFLCLCIHILIQHIHQECVRHSGNSEYWSAIARFDSTNEMVQKDFMVRKTSGTSRTLRLYVNAQGDGSNRYLSNVQYGFYKFSEI